MWLALDTATDQATVALGLPGRVLARETIAGARRHAAALLPAIERCLALTGAGFAELEGVVLADGPGSFTGLRVGASVAKALIRVRPMPLWVAPSLLVCAAGAVPASGRTVLAASNALRGELFVAAYRFHPGRIETMLAPTVLTPDQIPQRVAGDYQLVGPSAPALGGQPTWPDAGALLGLVGVAGGVRAVPNVAQWEPEYGRPAEAQAKWERDHGRPLADPARANG
jgi:tRNA threonylcarbamoyladenosine biosynthesis protein TsaB